MKYSRKDSVCHDCDKFKSRYCRRCQMGIAEAKRKIANVTFKTLEKMKENTYENKIYTES